MDDRSADSTAEHSPDHVDWTVVSGPGHRLEDVTEILSSLSGSQNADLDVGVAQIEEITQILPGLEGPGRLLLDGDLLDADDFGLLRWFLNHHEDWSLAILGDDPSRRISRQLLALDRVQWVPWPPDLDQLRSMVRAPRNDQGVDSPSAKLNERLATERRKDSAELADIAQRLQLSFEHMGALGHTSQNLPQTNLDRHRREIQELLHFSRRLAGVRDGNFPEASREQRSPQSPGRVTSTEREHSELKGAGPVDPVPPSPVSAPKFGDSEFAELEVLDEVVLRPVQPEEASQESDHSDAPESDLDEGGILGQLAQWNLEHFGKGASDSTDSTPPQSSIAQISATPTTPAADWPAHVDTETPAAGNPSQDYPQPSFPQPGNLALDLNRIPRQESESSPASPGELDTGSTFDLACALEERMAALAVETPHSPQFQLSGPRNLWARGSRSEIVPSLDAVLRIARACTDRDSQVRVATQELKAGITELGQGLFGQGKSGPSGSESPGLAQVQVQISWPAGPLRKLTREQLFDPAVLSEALPNLCELDLSAVAEPIHNSGGRLEVHKTDVAHFCVEILLPEAEVGR